MLVLPVVAELGNRVRLPVRHEHRVVAEAAAAARLRRNPPFENAGAAVKMVADGKIPPIVDITSPQLFEILYPQRATTDVEIHGTISAKRAKSYTAKIQWAPGVEPDEDKWQPVAEIPMQASNTLYEAAFAEALGRIQGRWPDVDTIAFGDLFLTEVREYRESLLARLTWKGLYPIWGFDTHDLATSFVARGHRAILTCVDTTQLDAGFAGRAFDEDLLDDLPSAVDPCGERGEFHSCLVGGPLLGESIPVKRGEQVLRDGRFQYCDLIPT